MIVPKRAPVRPRAISPDSGAVLLLEEVVQDCLQRGSNGTLAIEGPPGSGKTTALAHLAETLSGNVGVSILDCPSKKQLAETNGWVIYAPPEAEMQPTIVVKLAPWDFDDCIEYLLAVHKDACPSVVARLRAREPDITLAGNPQLWTMVLDAMASEASLASPREALARSLAAIFQTESAKTIAAKACLHRVIHGSWESSPQQEVKAESARVLRHWPVQILMATEQVLYDLRAKSRCDYFRLRWPRALVDEVGVAASQERRICAKLEKLVLMPELQAMAVSVLHAAQPLWVPQEGTACKLAGAYLAGVQWRGLNLCELDLSDVDLRGADLAEAKLDKAVMRRTNLTYASLRGASLDRLEASEIALGDADLSKAHAREAKFDNANLENANFVDADLSKASFTNANLRGVRFDAANLSDTKLVGVQLQDADFAKANLEYSDLSGLTLNEAHFQGANFRGAQLAGANMEGMELTAPNFEEANLTDALLTGSSMCDAHFDGACLAGAGLAEVDWPRASLCCADLTGASFHLGSSRSGLVGSPIACEGSRTGFYTDDYTEQDFKAPEEIRKANLRGADLRGAVIANTDFYLVDLREARIDPDQEAHLRRCGAILEARSL